MTRLETTRSLMSRPWAWNTHTFFAPPLSPPNPLDKLPSGNWNQAILPTTYPKIPTYPWKKEKSSYPGIERWTKFVIRLARCVFLPGINQTSSFDAVNIERDLEGKIKNSSFTFTKIDDKGNRQLHTIMKHMEGDGLVVRRVFIDGKEQPMTIIAGERDVPVSRNITHAKLGFTRQPAKKYVFTKQPYA